MEASGQGGDGAAQNGQQGDGQGAEQQQGGPDFGAFTQQLESLSSSQDETRQALQGISEWVASQQQDGQEGEGEPELDLSFLSDEAAMTMDPQQLQGQLGDVINQAVQQQVQSLMGPQQEAIANMRMEQQARDLVGEFPELGQDEVAKQVVGLAAQIADQNFPPEVAKVLNNSPAWWRQVYLSGRGVEAANEQNGAESPQAAQLEGGGGAAPAGGNQRQGPYFQNPNGGGAKLPF